MKTNERFQGSGGAAKSGSMRPLAGYRLGPVPGMGAIRVPDVAYASGSFMHDAEATDMARPVGGMTEHKGITIK